MSLNRYSAYRILSLCLLQIVGCAATIQKKDGQVVTGEIQGNIAIKSTTAVVTQDGQQYTAVFYVLTGGKTITQIDAKDVTLTSGQYAVFALSWSLSGSAMPPSDVEAVTTDSTTSPPSGFPIAFGFFDSGAGWAQLLVSASSAGTASSLFAVPANIIRSTNIPALLAKPAIGNILGEFGAGGSLTRALRVLTSGGPVTVSLDDLAPFPGPTISTSVGTFAITGAQLADRFPPGCSPGPGCSTANSGSQVLFVSLLLQGSLSGSDTALFNTSAYVLAQDGSQTPVFSGGLLNGKHFIAFTPPAASKKFILYWPNNNAVDITSFLIGSAPAISAGGIGPVYSTSTTIQPGAWASIYGSNLANGTATWNGDFPTSLGDVSVTVNNKPAYLWYVSPTQINMQAPDDATTGPVNVVVTNSLGSATATVTLAPVSPSFLVLDGKHVAGIIIRTDGSGAYGGGTYDILGPTGTSFGYKTVAAKAGDTVELFGVGFGPTSPPVPAGKPYSGAATTTNPVSLLVNNTSVTPGFAGITGAGLYQLNVTIPPGLGTGDVSLQAVVAGLKTQTFVVLALQ